MENWSSSQDVGITHNGSCLYKVRMSLHQDVINYHRIPMIFDITSDYEASTIMAISRHLFSVFGHDIICIPHLNSNSKVMIFNLLKTLSTNGKLEQDIQNKLKGLEGLALSIASSAVENVGNHTKGIANQNPAILANIYIPTRVLLYQFRSILLHLNSNCTLDATMKFDKVWWDICIPTLDGRAKCCLQQGYALAKWRNTNANTSNRLVGSDISCEHAPYVSYAFMDALMFTASDDGVEYSSPVPIPSVEMQTEYALYRAILPTYKLLCDYMQISRPIESSSQSPTHQIQKVVHSIIVDYCTVPMTSKFFNNEDSKQEDLILTCFLSGETGRFIRYVEVSPSKPSKSVDTSKLASLLTKHNIRNRNRGYELYLPGNAVEQHQQYWLNNYGYDIYDAHPCSNCSFGSHSELKGQSLVMVEVEMDYGSRMFPLPVLCLGMGKMEYRSNREAAKVLNNMCTKVANYLSTKGDTMIDSISFQLHYEKPIDMEFKSGSNSLQVSPPKEHKSRSIQEMRNCMISAKHIKFMSPKPNAIDAGEPDKVPPVLPAIAMTLESTSKNYSTVSAVTTNLLTKCTETDQVAFARDKAVQLSSKVTRTISVAKGSTITKKPYSEKAKKKVVRKKPKPNKAALIPVTKLVTSIVQPQMTISRPLHKGDTWDADIKGGSQDSLDLCFDD